MSMVKERPLRGNSRTDRYGVSRHRLLGINLGDADLRLTVCCV